MEKTPFSGEKPNFTTKEAERAETNLDSLIETMKILGFSCVEVNSSSEALIDAARKIVPERLRLVDQKLNAKDQNLSEMPPNIVLDKLYGVDKIIEYKGRTFFIDATTAKTTGIKNKINKFTELENLLRSVGGDHAVVLSLRKDDVSEDAAIKFAAALEDASEFVVDVRLHNL